MSKPEVNKILKEHGLTNVTLSSGGWSGMGEKTYRDADNKMVKGISCASHGPMTVTDAHRVATEKKMREVKCALVSSGFPRDDVDNDRFVVKKTRNKTTYVRLCEQWYPAYLRSANLDDGYKNIYIVPVYSEEKSEP